MSKHLETFHSEIVRETFDGPVSDELALAILTVLHVFAMRIKPGVLENNPHVLLAAITQRHAAECVSGLWEGVQDERNHYAYWYAKWNHECPAEVPESVPARLQQSVVDAKSRMEAHPCVVQFVEEET